MCALYLRFGGRAAGSCGGDSRFRMAGAEELRAIFEYLNQNKTSSHEYEYPRISKKLADVLRFLSFGNTRLQADHELHSDCDREALAAEGRSASNHPRGSRKAECQSGHGGQGLSGTGTQRRDFPKRPGTESSPLKFSKTFTKNKNPHI